MMNMAQQLIDEAKKLLKEAGDENARLRAALDVARTALLNIERRSEEVRASLTDLLIRPEPPDVDVGCECGWRGKQRELAIYAPAMKSEKCCPDCGKVFKAVP